MSASGQSASSLGSGVDSDNNKGTEEVDESARTFEAGLLGVLYTVSKEKAPSLAFVAFRLFLDWLQVFLLLVNPQYGWNIDPDNKVWQAFSFIQLNYFMSVRGYTFFLICMYILAVALAANLGLCIWVSNSFKNNKFDHVWPIVWLRYFSLVFYQVLDVASLTLFLMTMDCGYFPGPTQGMNQEFPDVQCWQMPHMIHIAVAAASIAIFFVLATIFTMAEIELNPISRNLMGMAHTKAEVYGFAIKMFMTCATVFVNELHWLSVVQLVGAFLLCYLYLKWLPHLNANVNHVRVGSYFSVLWAALLFIIMAYEPGVNKNDAQAVLRMQSQMTAALWAGFLPIGFLGGLCSWWRTRYFALNVAQKFRDAPANQRSVRIYAFTDAREVEIASRCCRKWVDEDHLDEDEVHLAERIIKAGMQQLPREPYMVIWWSSFLIDVQGSYQSGYVALQDAKKMASPSFLERFCIFIREQEHTQKTSAASSGDNANIDLVSYVEFQRDYRLTIRLHVDALLAKKSFWETLLHTKVSFDKLANAVQRIEVTVRASEQMYRQVLSRHSNSVKILVLYVKFLQSVRNDPWSAARWSAEAEKLQKLEEEANERAVFGEGAVQNKATGGIQSKDDTKGVIVMGANCIIRMINEQATEMLGYGNVRGELMGKNVNLIVPPPFSRHHNNYIRNYLTTGKAKVLDNLCEVVALHKDRYVVPVSLYVTKVSGMGEDSVFMGVIQGVPLVHNTATVWVLNGGTMLSCDSSFTDWLGYKHEDIYGKHVGDLVTKKMELEDMMTQIRQETQAALLRKPAINASTDASTGAASWTPSCSLVFRHCYLDAPVTCDVTVKIGGIGDTAMYVFKLTRHTESSHLLMVTDAKGRINHVTKRLAHRLGTTVTKLQAGNMVHALDTLLPVPYMRIHHQWYRDKVDVPPAWSCRSGLSMCLAGMGPEGPITVPFSLKFSKKEAPGKEPLNLIQFEEVTVEQMLDQRRLSLILNHKGIIVQAGNSPASLFGFNSQALVGLHLAYLIDVLCPPLAHNTSKQDTSAEEARVTKMLMHMAERSYANPGMSWRVGVSAISDPAAVASLGPIAAAMMAKRTVPACMVVDAHMAVPEMDGATLLLPTEMHLKVELWRSDLLSGLLELDTQGNITQLGMKNRPAFSHAHVLLGATPNLLTGAAFNALVPMHGKTVVEAMFTEGGLAPPKGPGGGAGGGKAGAKGGMRGTGQYARRHGIGPVHTVKITHCTDGSEVEVTVQAVVKQDIGVGCSLFILMHLVTPKCGRADFRNWIWDSPPPSLPSISGRRASRRASALDIMTADSAMAPSGDLPTKAQRRVQTFNTSKAQLELPDRASPDDMAKALPDKVTGVSLHEVAEMPVLETAFYTKSFDIDEVTAEVDSSRPFPPPAGLSDSRKTGRSRAALKHKDSKLGRPSSKDSRRASMRKRDGASIKGGKKGKAQDDDDASSVDSAPLGLKDGGRENIKNWMTAAAANSVHGSHSDEDTESEDEEEDDDQNPEEEEIDEDADHIDEAGAEINDFKRGKRLKRIIKMNMSPQAQAPRTRLKWVAIAVVATLIIVDLAMFVTFMQMVSVQTKQVFDLRTSSRAVNRVMQLAISTSSLEIVLAGKSSKQLRHLGKEGNQVAIDYTMEHMEKEVTDMDTYHRGIYRGFGTTRQLPKSFNLRTIWEEPLLPIRTFYTSPNGTMSTLSNMSLWDAGNLFIKSARNILQNMEAEYGLKTNNSLAFENSTDVLFILFNGPRSILNAYQDTLDGLMQQSIIDSKKTDEMQLIIVAVEGGLVGVAVVIIMWITASRLAYRRLAIFSVFMVVPQGMIRALATKATDLDPDQEEDDTDREPGTLGGDSADAEAAGGASAGAGSGYGADMGSGQKRAAASKINFTTQAAQSTEAQPKTFLGKLKSWMSFLHSNNANEQRERRVQRSLYPVLWMTWPFMLWAAFVIVINAYGFIALNGISAPIAISNIVQFMSIRVNRVLLFSQRYVSEQYLDPHNYYAAQYIPSNMTYNPLKETYRETLSADYDMLRLEYDAMLYGHEGSRVVNQTSPHFQLATTGIMFTQGAELMYNSRVCMCQQAADCQASTSHFYRYTMNGVDAMLKQLFYSVEALIMQSDDEADMNSEHFIYIYEVGNSDIFGAVILLTDTYSTFVMNVYKEALNLHVVALAVCCTMGVLFLLCMLRPHLTRVTAENKRVAELLSQLPPEVDVEGMLGDALKADRSARDPQAAIEAAAAAKEAAKASTTMGRSRRGSMDNTNHAVYEAGPSSPMKRKSLEAPPVK